MKANTRKVAMLLTGVIFVGSCGMLIRQLFQYQQGGRIYDGAAQLVEMPDLTEVQSVPAAPLPSEVISEEPSPETEAPTDPYADALENMNFAALREVNEDVLGWIMIPDTNLSYPLLQGEDNDYYLNHAWEKSRNAVGSIFVDYRSSADLSDFHTVIYGHRMNNESMFGQLHNYKNAEYWEEHPKLYIADDNGSHTYEIFAMYMADSMETYQMDFDNRTEKWEFICYTISRTWVNTGVVPEVTDRIITLSTCTGNGHDTRWVVHAVLAE